MREKKFKALDKHKKVFIPNEFWAVVTTDFGAFGIMLKDWENYKEGEYFYENSQELIQFTGLHDRNGKEVFADDILKDSVGHLFRVYACIGGFAIKAEYWRSDLSDLIIGDELILTSLIDAQMQSYISGSVEIIGNRFENPELL